MARSHPIMSRDWKTQRSIRCRHRAAVRSPMRPACLLSTRVLQMVGQALGVDFNDDPNSVMDLFSTTNTTFDASDIAAIQAVYATVPAASPPTISGAAAGQKTTDQTAIAPFSHVTIAEANSGVPRPSR